MLKWHTDLEMKENEEVWCSYWAFSTEGHLKSKALTLFTCDVEILDWSWRAVRSEEDTLAGAPRWSRMLTFLSLSAREIARGDVLPKITLCATLASTLGSESQ